MYLKYTEHRFSLLGLTDQEPGELWTETIKIIREQCEKTMSSVKRKNKNKNKWQQKH